MECDNCTRRGTLGDTDRDQLALAKTNDWLLVTFDDDFLSLVEGEGVEHAGVLYVQQTDRQIGDGCEPSTGSSNVKV